MLDYDKKFLLKSEDNLTFDGSSVRGFSAQHESDLRLNIDWSAFYWLPADVFGPGKVLVFSEVLGRDGSPTRQTCAPPQAVHRAALRQGRPRSATWRPRSRASSSRAATPSAATTRPASSSTCRRAATTTRCRATSCALHRHRRRGAARDGLRQREGPPRGGAQPVRDELLLQRGVITADQVQLYKLLCRQVAANMGMTASFLPKPVTGVNGNGMHTNMSFNKARQEPVLGRQGRQRRPVEAGLGRHRPHPHQRRRHLPDPEPVGERVPPARPALRGAEPDQGLGQQPRLDGAHPHRQRAQRAHRGAQRGPRREPLHGVLHVMRTALEGTGSEATADESKRSRTRFLPDNIYDAIRLFKGSKWVTEMLGEACRASSPS
jgi:glutamine synthetase